MLAFVRAARVHSRSTVDETNVDTTMFPLFDHLSQICDRAQEWCVRCALVRSPVLLDYAAAVAYTAEVPNVLLQQLLADLGEPAMAPTASLSEHLDRPLIGAFAASDAYTHRPSRRDRLPPYRKPPWPRKRLHRTLWS